MQRVSSKDNPRLAEAARLVASSRDRRKSGKCVLEGDHPIGVYLERIGRPETLVVVAGNENTPPIGRIDAATLMHLRQADIIMALSDLGLRPLSRGEPGINIL